MARYFDGSTYAAITSDPALVLGDDVDNSGEFSFSFWVNKDVMANSDSHYLMYWGITEERVVIAVEGDTATAAGAITVIFASAYSGSDRVILVFNEALVTNQWHHVALVFDGTTLRAWLDNSLQTTMPTCSGLDTIDRAEPWYFGWDNDHVDRYLTGDMAEVAKWDDALSSGQVTSLNNGIRPTEIGITPAWYISMEDGFTETISGLVIDDSGSISSTHPSAVNTHTYIGASLPDGEFIDGEIAELVVYDKFLNDSEMLALYRYLNNKYDL